MTPQKEERGGSVGAGELTEQRLPVFGREVFGLSAIELAAVGMTRPGKADIDPSHGG